MKLIEEKRDLFTVGEDYYFAHCISQDFALGAGVAIGFNHKYDMRRRLKQTYIDIFNNGFCEGKCLPIDNVFNLVTKYKYWHKPTYHTLRNALLELKEFVIDENVIRLAVPRIGCGLDRLQWNKVKELLEDVFKDVDVEILVCSL